MGARRELERGHGDCPNLDSVGRIWPSAAEGLEAEGLEARTFGWRDGIAISRGVIGLMSTEQGGEPEPKSKPKRASDEQNKPASFGGAIVVRSPVYFARCRRGQQQATGRQLHYYAGPAMPEQRRSGVHNSTWIGHLSSVVPAAAGATGRWGLWPLCS